MKKNAKAKAGGAQLVILDIPLLFETGGQARMDAVVVVSAPQEVQRTRVLAREGISELQEGQRIHMKVVPGAKGLEATSVELKHDM